MKLRIQAQHLQPGDIVGSAEKVLNVIVNSISHPSSKVRVVTDKRMPLWGKYTMINVEREEVKA